MEKTCCIDGCRKNARTKGMCPAHYGRYLRLGSPTAGPAMIDRGLRMKWIKDNAHHRGDECLIWPFRKHKGGSGSVFFDGKYTPAARVMCLIAHGEPENKSLYALHSCGNGHLACCNPSHLRWGTQSENMQDAIAHGTTTQGTKSPASKLQDADVLSIRDDTRMHKDIAKDYGVSKSLISLIKRRERWGWLK